MRDSIPCWQKILAQGFNSAVELLDFLDLPRTLAEPLAEQTFKTRVPRGFAERMRRSDPSDPLLLQVLAVPAELPILEGYSHDPLLESTVNPIPGLIHKYRSRVLLTLTGACAIHCRYCFRRHFPYEENNPGRGGWDRAFEYISNDSRINEVILSGGDPLLAKDAVLAAVFAKLSEIPHVRTVRIHTRIPIVLPERVNDELLACLNDTQLHKVVVIHCNHPQELNHQTFEACRALRAAGCHLLNQTVYLAGINNHAKTLACLSEALFAQGVLPYYLHVLDKVHGAAHFDASMDEIYSVFGQLQGLLPGYLVPRLVREESGQLQKSLLTMQDRHSVN
jgi:EF-P beta-lysylation protein EpmB